MVAFLQQRTPRHTLCSVYFIGWLCSKWPRGNFVNRAFQNVSKSDKNSENETKDYHKKGIRKRKKTAMTIEDSNEAVTHDNHENDKDEKNLYILKVITGAVLSC